MTNILQGYLETSYLNNSYLNEVNHAIFGNQFNVIIEKETPLPNQFYAYGNHFLPSEFFRNVFMHRQNNGGYQQLNYLEDEYLEQGDTQGFFVDFAQQFNTKIENYLSGFPTQFNAVIETDDNLPLQFRAIINDYLSGFPNQINAVIETDDNLPVQFNAVIETDDNLPVQFRAIINDYLSGFPNQINAVIETDDNLPVQFNAVIETDDNLPVQFRAIINDYLSGFPNQFKVVSEDIFLTQFRVVLYNTISLRIMYEFPSRGISGTNWTASNTAVGDYNVNNVNTDIIEQVWRSTGVAANLVCDTELPQGVFLDTLAILNHNFTGTAFVQLEGSNDPTFTTSTIISILQATKENMYYIAPELPNVAYRYYRIVLNDPANTAGFLQVGTIVFGDTLLFTTQECFTNPVTFNKKHYVDSVNTEGFTNVSNDRATKRQLKLNFEKLNLNGANFSLLEQLFETAKTDKKCLWIPTPKYPTRFAIFGKLTQLPQASYTDNGKASAWVSFDIEVDEAL
jgi:hypothetical protein